MSFQNKSVKVKKIEQRKFTHILLILICQELGVENIERNTTINIE